MNVRLRGSDAVEELFGSWPSFHDAEILRIEVDRGGPRIAVDLLTHASCRQGRDILVRFAFHAVDDLSLDGFNHQNVIWSLAIEPASQERLRITFHSVFGAALSFRCARGEVLDATPSDLRTGRPG